MLEAIFHQLPAQIPEATAVVLIRDEWSWWSSRAGNRWCVSSQECRRGIKAHDSLSMFRRSGGQQGELLPSRSSSPDASKMG